MLERRPDRDCCLAPGLRDENEVRALAFCREPPCPPPCAFSRAPGARGARPAVSPANTKREEGSFTNYWSLFNMADKYSFNSPPPPSNLWAAARRSLPRPGRSAPGKVTFVTRSRRAPGLLSSGKWLFSAFLPQTVQLWGPLPCLPASHPSPFGQVRGGSGPSRPTPGGAPTGLFDPFIGCRSGSGSGFAFAPATP